MGIRQLPAELLHKVLLHVRNDCGVSSLQSCLTVSKRWYESTLPLLCHDLRVTNSNLPTFVEKFPLSNGPLVRSLTVSIHSPLLQWEATEDELEQWFWHGSPETRAIWTQLQCMCRLKVSSMTGLLSFSFVVCAELQVEHKFWINQETLITLVESLPQSCQSVEFDTNGKDHCGRDRFHVCDSIRRLLPRLKHLRLRFSVICQSVFCEGPVPLDHSGMISKDPADYHPVSAPLLETALVNYTQHRDGSFPVSYVLDCNEVRRPELLNFNPDRPVNMVQAIKALLEQGKCPSIKRFSLIDSTSRDNNYLENLTTVNRRDMVENRSYFMPHETTVFGGLWEGRDRLRTFSGEDVVAGVEDIEAFAEGEMWKETTNGFRLPAALLDVKPDLDPEYVQHVVKPLSLTMVDPLKFDSVPADSLWRSEYLVGTRLLAAVQLDGVFETWI